ncbi:MAG: phage baseplate plug family protein, partial [Planctomycetota bacterium]
MSVFLLEPVDRRDQFPFWEFTYALGGVEVTMRLTWSDRLGNWYADLFDADGETIWAGVKINVRHSIGFRTLSERRPDGFFYASDTNEDLTTPDFEDLGRRVLLS